MTGKGILAAAAALTLLAAALWLMLRPASSHSYIDPADARLVQRGQAVYAQYCAACHGERLQGQPNWRDRLPNGRLPAPPHDASGHTWHHPDAVLVDIVRHGMVPGRTAPDGYESDMPAYAGVLAEQDIVAVLAYIKSQWPETAREAQAEVTRSHAESLQE